MAYDHEWASIRFGYWSDSDTGGGTSAAVQWANTIAGGNYDYVSGTRTWYNPVTAQTIPDSYFYTSKPAYFGSLNWPPIDPTTPTVGEAVIPAGYRFLYGDDPVVSTTNPPAITVQPVSATTRTNLPVTFTVTATGSATLFYTWSLAGSPVAGATSSSWTYTPTVAAVNNVWVGITNAYGGVQSATVTVTSTNAVPVSISVQPQDQTVLLGSAAVFTVTAAGQAPLSYQWRRGGTNVAGATLSSWSYSSPTVQTSLVSVIVSNVVGPLTSANATLQVTNGEPPTIVSQPISVAVLTGDAATFAIGATGSGTLAYQWKVGGTNIAGATRSGFTYIPTLPCTNSILCGVTNSFGGTVSAAGVTVIATNGAIPVIITQLRRAGHRGSHRRILVAHSGHGRSGQRVLRRV
jgi:hypothetical protein